MDNIRGSLKNIFIFLCKPFTECIRFFITVFLMSAIVDIIGYTQLVSFPKAIFIALHHYVICYMLTFILCLLPVGIKKWYKVFIYLLLIVNLLIDSICIFKFHVLFDAEMVSIAYATNINEVYEFIKTFISIDFIFVVSLLFIAFCVLNRILSKIKIKIDKKVSTVLLSLVIISILSFVFISSKNFGLISVTKIYTMIDVEVTPNLKDYYVNPKLSFVKDIKPKNIVMIIGESFSKSHSSLYGYEKNTNPLLSILKNKGELYVFPNVRSPELHTIEVFRALMSTYKPEYKDSIKWYECLTLQETLSNSGYNQVWISNQSKIGLYDNVVSKYSELCDTAIFVGDCYANSKKWISNDYDELLLSPLTEYKNAGHSENNFYFIHMMGSHNTFNNRYPKSFDIFKYEDYLDKKEWQRKILAEYDNSVLYNDSIVNEIIKVFSKDEAIVFYFSDHALDLYQSRDDYAGHGRANDVKSVEAGSDIPFMIYISPKYQEKFHENCEKIKQSINKEFRTDDMIYTIMDIIGVKFEDNDDVYNCSLLSLSGDRI